MCKKQFYALPLIFVFISFITYSQPDPKLISSKYIIAFHACNTSGADCMSTNANKYIYLAYSDDGISWKPVANIQPFRGSVPDLLKRGDTLYIYTPDPDIVTRYIISTGTIISSVPIIITKSDGSTDDLGDISSYLDPATNKIVIFYKSTKGFSGDPINCTTCSLRSATEIEGSNGTRFLMDSGDRLSGVLFSDNDIFYDGSKYVQLAGGAGTNKKTLAFTSSTLKGTYSPVSTLPNGVLTESGAVPQGYYDPLTNKYWTYITILSPNAPAVIKRAVHNDFTRQLTEADFTTVLSGSTFPGFTSAYTVESPGFVVNSISLPSIPTLLSPLNGAAGISLNPTLSWNTSSGATTYRLQVSTNSNFSTIVFDDSTLTSTSKQIGQLLNNTVYYWRVNAKNSGGNCNWSNIFSFTTIIALPTVPNLSSPSNGAAGFSLNPTLSWNTSSGATTYRLQVSTYSNFSTIVFDDSTLTSTSKQIGPLLNNTIYYWRVNAKNSGGTGNWSDIWKFTTKMMAPSIPNLIFPPNNAILSFDFYNPVVYLFIWNTCSNATEYRVQVSNLIDFKTTIKDERIKDTALKVPDHGNPCYWRVRALNVDTVSDWSNIFSFSTKAVSVEKINDNIPTEFKLLQNYPNPFNPSTRIKYYLPEAQFVILKIYNTLGEEIEVLVNSNQMAGIYSVTWQPNSSDKRLSSGIYYYKMQTEKYTGTKKMLYLN